VLDDFMVSAYSTKVSQLLTNGSHHRNISLVLITGSSQLHYLHLLKEVKPQDIRALLTFADDGLIKVTVDCGLNTLNCNHTLTKEGKCKLSKHKKSFTCVGKDKY
jgi:hypothetical protein